MNDARTPQAWQLITFFRKTCDALAGAYTPDERAPLFIALHEESCRQFAEAYGRPHSSNDELVDWVGEMTEGCEFDTHGLAQ
jgi:hypothetical protein